MALLRTLLLANCLLLLCLLISESEAWRIRIRIRVRVRVRVWGKRSVGMEPDAYAQAAYVAQVYGICDKNDNGDLNKREFDTCFDNPTYQLDGEFQKLDADESKTISYEEFNNADLDLPGARECYANMVLRCGALFIFAGKVYAGEEKSLCLSTQEYVDCAARMSAHCKQEEVTWFMQGLKDLVNDGEIASVCEDIDATKLAKHGRDSKHASNLGALTCGRKAIMNCDLDFLLDLHKGMEGCEASSAYDQCFQESLQKCQDGSNEKTTTTDSSITKAYKNLLCDSPESEKDKNKIKNKV